MNKLDESFRIPKHNNQETEKSKKEYEAKISLMKEAAKDNLFLKDLNEVMDDFKYADFENIE